MKFAEDELVDATDKTVEVVAKVEATKAVIPGTDVDIDVNATGLADVDVDVNATGRAVEEVPAGKGFQTGSGPEK